MSADRTRVSESVRASPAARCAIACLCLFALLALSAAVCRADGTPTPTPTNAQLRTRADALHKEAIALYEKKDLEGAVDRYGQALLLYATLGDQRKEAILSNDLALVVVEIGLPARAVSFYEHALDIWRRLGDKASEAITLNNMALAQLALNAPDEAVTLYEQASAAQAAAGDRSRAAAALRDAGNVRYGQNRYTEALSFHQRALSLFAEAGDQNGQAQTLWKMALAAGGAGDWETELSNYAAALDIFRALGDTTNERTTLSLMATVYQFRGKWLDALAIWQQVRAMDQRSGRRDDEALSTYSLALIYDGLGQTTRAREAYQQSLALYRALGSGPSEAFVLGNLATLHSRSGDHLQAIAYLQEALAIQRSLGERRAQGEVLNSLGQAYMAQGDLDKAQATFEDALTIDRAVGNQAEEGAVLFNIGLVYFQRGNYNTAIGYFEQALPLHRAANIPARVWRTLNDLCITYDMIGESQKALALCQESLDLQRQALDPASIWLILANTGYVQSHLGNVAQARELYEQAMSAYEQARAAVQADDARALLEGQFAGIYAGAVNLYMTEGRAERAFDIAERARARTFLDQIGGAQITAHGSANAQLLDDEQNLRAQMAASERSLREELARPQTEQQAGLTQSLARQVADQQREYGQMLDLVRRSDAEYASLVSVAPLTLPEIQQQLPADETLISYYLTGDASYAYVVTASSLHTVTLPVTYTQIFATVRAFYDFASLEQTPPPELVQLYDWLMAPLQAYVKTDVVGIIPHSILHYVPFAALSDGRRYLGEQHALYVLPNASTLRFLAAKRKSEQGPLLAVAYGQALGLPTLHYAEAEATTIAGMYGSTPLLGAGATRSAFAGQASQAGIIHVAAHGQLNAIDPLLSRIVLAPDAANDGSLTVADVYNLNLQKADLVVLSACQTQAGALSAGDEIVGLTRAFIYAGSPSVVSSLWSVDDQATGKLMTAFYTHLRKGMSKAEALRAAQADTRAQFAHPYYWAGFVLTGDPGQAGRSERSMAAPLLLAAGVMAVCAVGLAAARRRTRTAR